jgi:dolichol-phosphate mannosyltransferase
MTHSNQLPVVSRHKRLDIVIPLFNEEEVIRQLHSRVSTTARALPLPTRILYVDDGSRDRTIERLRDLIAADESVELLQLSRNFGQAAAIHAGLEASDADAVVLMDGDLQDPPELIAEMVTRWLAGESVVIARRHERDEGSWLRKIGFKTFHKVFQWLSDHHIPADCGTFCLMEGRVRDVIVAMPEAHRFFPGVRAWVGFEQGFVDYARPQRAAGSPKQTFRRLLNYACDGIFSFSKKPARLLMAGGACQAAIGLAAALTVITQGLLTNATIWNWPLCGALVVLLFGVQLFGIGIVAELAFRIYDEVKLRPKYLIHSRSVLAEAKAVESHSRQAIRLADIEGTLPDAA